MKEIEFCRHYDRFTCRKGKRTGIRCHSKNNCEFYKPSLFNDEEYDKYRQEFKEEKEKHDDYINRKTI